MAFIEEIMKTAINKLRAAPWRLSLGVVMKDDGSGVTPMTESMVRGAGAGTGSPGGGVSDPESAREATLKEILAKLPAPAGVSLGWEALPLTDAPQGLQDIPEGATLARISVRGGPASIAVAGPAPTATAGDYWGEFSAWELDAREFPDFKAVKVSGTPVLRVTYYGAVPVEVS